MTDPENHENLRSIHTHRKENIVAYTHRCWSANNNGSRRSLVNSYMFAAIELLSI